MLMKWKNATGVRVGVESAFNIFLAHAKGASRQARRYRAMYLQGEQWAHSEWLHYRSERTGWINSARLVRELTHDGVPRHIVGWRKYNRVMQKAA